MLKLHVALIVGLILSASAATSLAQQPSADPCETTSCGAYGFCVVKGDKPVCACFVGFRLDPQTEQCVPVSTAKAAPVTPAPTAEAAPQVPPAAAPVAPTGCNMDNDCPGEQVCEGGACANPPAGPGAPCAIDNDCPGELICRGRVCASSGTTAATSPTSPAAASPTVASPTAAPVPPGTPLVDVLFVKEEPEINYQLQVSSPVAGWSVSCTPPCTLSLPPGEVKVNVTGDVEFEQELEISASERFYEIEHRKNGLFWAGFTTAIIGIGGSIAMIIVMNSKDPNQVTVAEANRNLGITIVVGVVALTGAILLLAAGNNELEEIDESDLSDYQQSAKRVRFEGLGLTPVDGGGAVGLSWSF